MPNARLIVPLLVIGMSAGAPTPENSTLWSPVNAQFTLPPTPMVTLAGAKVLDPVALTLADDATEDGAVTITVAFAVAVMPSRVSDAVIVLEPGAMVVTVPAASTSAFERSLVTKVAPETPAIVLFRASRAVTASDTTAPIPSDVDAGLTDKLANRCATSTASVACTVPLVAVMVAEPLPVAVTVALLPAPDTVATDAFDVDQLTAALAMTLWLASRTVALATRVSLIETNAPADADTMEMEAGVGVGCVLPLSPPPHAAVIRRTTSGPLR